MRYQIGRAHLAEKMGGTGTGKRKPPHKGAGKTTAQAFSPLCISGWIVCVFVFLVPLPGHGTIRFPDALIGAVRAVFLPGGSHSVLFPAADAFVRTAKKPICNASFGSMPAVCLLCPLTPAGGTVPGPRAAVKGGAALAAGTGQHDNGHTITQAVLLASPGSRCWG